MMSTPWKKWTAALTVALFLALTVMPAWAATATLRQGSRGQAVTELQQDLNTLGYAAAEEKGQQDGPNMGAVLVGVRKDNDLMVFKRINIEMLVDTAPQRGDDGAEFFVGQHGV